MKTLVIVILFALCLSGCAASSAYYRNPNSAGYHKPGLGGLCESCGRQFIFSGYQLNNFENITCPYCGYEQNIQMAANRWTYEAQRQQTYANQQTMQTLMQGVGAAMEANREGARRKSQIIRDHMNRQQQTPRRSMLPSWESFQPKPGDSRYNPLYIKDADD